MMPAKVELSPSLKQMSPSLKPVAHDDQLWNKFEDLSDFSDAAEFSSGEWASKVHNVTPYLNTKGLHRALAILDQAIFNVQRAKAIKDMADVQAGFDAAMGYTGMNDFQHAMTCTLMQAQVNGEQQQLLSELQQLPFDPASVRPELLSISGTVQNRPNNGLAANASVDAGIQSALLRPAPGSATAEAPAQQQKAGAKAAPASTRRVQTLSTSLQLLSGEDPDCLFIVRRINKLGFKAVRILKRHFSTYGSVTKVLLAHSTVRQHGDPSCHSRRRPSSLGFVQMTASEAVNKVLALGAEQEVEGIMIRVQRFERQRAVEALNEEQNEGEMEYQREEEDLAYDKFGRGLSEASTSAGSTSWGSFSKAGGTTESD
jgi:hypothetical protein